MTNTPKCSIICNEIGEYDLKRKLESFYIILHLTIGVFVMKDIRTAHFLSDKELEFCRITADEIETKANEVFTRDGKPILSKKEKDVIVAFLALGTVKDLESATTLAVCGLNCTELVSQNARLRKRLFASITTLNQAGRINSRQYYLSVIGVEMSDFVSNMQSFANTSHPHEETPKPSRIEVEKLLTAETFSKKFEKLLSGASPEEINYARQRLLAV